MPQYRVGIIGCGKMGTEHGRGYEANPDTEMVAAADPDAENLDAFCQRFGIRARYSDYREMLAKEKPDIVSIVVPVSVNPQAVIDSAEAAVKAIFAEKPISASLEEADCMVEACRAKRIPFACGAIWRNHPYMQEASRLLRQGEIGQVRCVTCFGIESEVSGGGCHSLNVMRLLAADADVDWVIGWLSGDPSSDNDQGAGGFLHFVNGIEGVIHLHGGAKGGIEVLGEWRVLHWDWHGLRLWKNMAPWERGPGVMEAVAFPYPQIVHPEIYPGVTGGVQSLLDCLEKGGEPLCSGDDMRKALEIAIALRESHRKGRVPVQLPVHDRTLKIIPSTYRWLGAKAAGR